MADGLYGTSIFQVKYTGTFRWKVNDQKCEVVTLAGTDTRTLPFDYTQNEFGDTPVFAVSTANVTVQVTDWSGNVSCDFWLHDPADGQLLDFKTAHKAAGGNPHHLANPGAQARLPGMELLRHGAPVGRPVNHDHGANTGWNESGPMGYRARSGLAPWGIGPIATLPIPYPVAGNKSELQIATRCELRTSSTSAACMCDYYPKV